MEYHIIDIIKKCVKVIVMSSFVNSKDDVECIIEGQLDKEGRIAKATKPRWFVLTPTYADLLHRSIQTCSKRIYLLDHCIHHQYCRSVCVFVKINSEAQIHRHWLRQKQYSNVNDSGQPR